MLVIEQDPHCLDSDQSEHLWIVKVMASLILKLIQIHQHHHLQVLYVDQVDHDE